MSHEIETAIFSKKEGAGWTGLGLEIPDDAKTDPRKLAELLGATWTVKTREAYYKTEEGQYALINGSAVQVRSDNGQVLSITSDTRYHVDHRHPLQVFGAFRDQLTAEKLEISHAAVLRGGQIIAVSALLPETDKLGGKDLLRHYVTLSTGFDKKHGTKCTLGTVRVVCANTLAWSISDATAKGELKTIRASSRLSELTLPEMVQTAGHWRKAVVKEYDALANKKMTDAAVSKYFADVLEIKIEDLGKVDKSGKNLIATKSENMLKALASAYKNAPGAVSASGSAWGALNAVTYYATHEKTCRDSFGDGADSARVASNMFGDSARLKARALELLQVAA